MLSLSKYEAGNTSTFDKPRMRYFDLFDCGVTLDRARVLCCHRARSSTNKYSKDYV